jgi:hypothetical protein
VIHIYVLWFNLLIVICGWSRARESQIVRRHAYLGCCCYHQQRSPRGEYEELGYLVLGAGPYDMNSVGCGAQLRPPWSYCQIRVEKDIQET